jgi:type I restriction enzyme S subunit
LGHPNPRSENDGAGSGMNALMKEVRDTAGSYALAEDVGEAVPAGYQRTEVGVIPEDWAVKILSDLAEVKGGKRLPLGKSLVDVPTPHPYVRVTDMRLGGVELDAIRYVPEDAFPSIRNYRIWCSDIFISVAGTLGIVGKIPLELDGANLTENADRITSLRCDRDFLLYNLMSTRIQNIIESAKTVGAQPKLALGQIQKFLIAVPPSDAEQRAIAAALSDVDALLLGLDQLIAKKRDLKQAAMQQLLTGQIRLPGFGDEWCKTQLGRLGRFSKGKGIRKDQVMTDGLPCVRYGEIYTRHHDVIRSFGSFISPGVASQSQRLLRGDLLFAGSGETAEEIGKCVAFLGDVEAYAGGDIVIFSPTKQDSMFLGYLMNAPKVAAQKARMGQGDAVVHIGAKNLAQLEFSLPSLEEQTAIATILSDMDAELATLETRRAKTRELKQGMMQALLTGRIRLT